jgi:hypothetical protein
MKIYKYQPINKNTLTGLHQAKLWVSKPSALNDPFEFRLKRSSTPKGFEMFRKDNSHNFDLVKLKDEELLPIAIKEYEKKIYEMGVVCFSKANDSILMWAHYGDHNKGMCLEFTFKNGQILPNTGFREVKYTEYYPEIDLEKVWHENGLAKVLWTKSKEWEHEKELRQIRISGNELIDYPIQLSGIIFGLRTPENEKELIKNILKDKDIKFQQIQLAHEEYKLEVISSNYLAFS